MDVGGIFTPGGLTKDIEAVEDFYGARGYIDVHAASRNLNVVKIPNTETGTMDLEFQIEEGQKSYIEKIEIHGNTKTKDKVIRRELAVSPGELFDMVRVKLSKQRLEGSGVLRARGHPAGADGRAESQEPHCGRGRKDHRPRVAGRGVQHGGLAGRHRGIQRVQLQFVPSLRAALVPGRRPEIPVAGDGRHGAPGLRAYFHRAVVPGSQTAVEHRFVLSRL